MHPPVSKPPPPGVQGVLSLVRPRRKAGQPWRVVYHTILASVVCAVIGLAWASAGAAVKCGQAPSTDHQSLQDRGVLAPTFIENAGQVNARASYYLKTGQGTLWLTAGGLVYDASMSGAGSDEQTRVVFSQDFVGANGTPTIESANAQTASFNFLLGNHPAQWHVAVPGFGAVVYHEVWHAIDVQLTARQGEIEEEYVVRPGGDASQVELTYSGIDRLQVDEDGSLVVVTPLGELRESPPRVYQQIDGQRVEVPGWYRLLSQTTYTFELGSYQPQYPLVIDPTLKYATFLGGAGDDRGRAVVVDSGGNAYVAGVTQSSDFPVVRGSMQTHLSGGLSNAFVAKLNPTGSGLVYATYLGGSGPDDARGIAVDAAGSAYVTGVTSSRDFPVVAGFQRTLDGPQSAFVSKLSADGTSLVYSTYLGYQSEGHAIAIDATGAAYLTGQTYGNAPFPTTAGAVQPAPGETAGMNTFVAKLTLAGSALAYSTYLGGSLGDHDTGNGIAVDALGSAYVTGVTASQKFPVTHALQATFPGGGAGTDHAFVARLTPTGGGLVYSTYLGGSGRDEGHAIAVDPAGNAYITGTTSSVDFPLQAPVQPAQAGSLDVFVTGLTADGAAMVYSTYLGGQNDDQGNGIAVDSNGNVYLTGVSISTNFPRVNPLPGGNNAELHSAFVEQIGPRGSQLVLSTELGTVTEGYAIAVDSAGAVYVVGMVGPNSPFQATPGATQTRIGGNLDAFIVKIDPAASASARSPSPFPNPHRLLCQTTRPRLRFRQHRLRAMRAGVGRSPHLTACSRLWFQAVKPPRSR